MRFLITGGSGFIGTNLISFLVAKYPRSAILNLDIKPARDFRQDSFFSYCDINSLSSLQVHFKSFAPTHVFHLAAATGVGDLPLSHFTANITGVKNVIDVSASCSALQRIIFASSLLVCRVGFVPDGFAEYCPSTNYGISKMKGEILVKNSPQSVPWVIVRPISIWGPWNYQPYTQFFQSILSGMYFNIGSVKSIRSLGYVLNTVYQLEKLAMADPLAVIGKTFYLADYKPSSLRYMAKKTASHRKLFKSIPTLPLALVVILAKVGDFVQLITGKPFPLTSFRLNNLLTEYVFDLSQLEHVCGPLPYDLDDGLVETLDWLRNPRSLF